MSARTDRHAGKPHASPQTSAPGDDVHAELGSPALRLLAAVLAVAAAAGLSALWPWGLALPLP